jgi:hypothetical protein
MAFLLQRLLTVLTLFLSMLACNVVAAMGASSVLKQELDWVGSVLENEIRWAEHAMETYNRKHDKFPLRSTIRGAPHVHSQKWTSDSREHLDNNVFEVLVDAHPKTSLRGI